MSDHEIRSDPNTTPPQGDPFPGRGVRIFFVVTLILVITLALEAMDFPVLLTALIAVAIAAPNWVADASLTDITLWSMWIALLRVLMELALLIRKRSWISELIRHGREDVIPQPDNSRLRGALRNGLVTGLAGAIVFAIALPDPVSALAPTGVCTGAGIAAPYAWAVGRWVARRLRSNSPQ
jgi:hypothetical protein